MENKLEYSFDDEPVIKVCYDLDNEIIEVHFKAYYDLSKNEYIKTPCIFIIENWKEAKSKVGDEEKFYPLDTHIGFFSLILYMKYDKDELEMLINTIDNRYVTLVFVKPKLSLK